MDFNLFKSSKISCFALCIALNIAKSLGQLWHGECAILLGATGGQWREAGHEEVQARERHKVHSDLPQIAVELPGEA